MLGTRLVTYQTTSEGQPVNAVLIESPCEIKRELYLSALVDRSKQRIVFMASSEGGVDIESVCGGRSLCGRCQVEVGRGEFAKHGITSGDDSL